MNEAVEQFLPKLAEGEYTDETGRVDSQFFWDTIGEYSEYIAGRINGSFNFKDWYEQTYGKTITSDQLELFVGEKAADLCIVVAEAVEDAVYDANQ